MSENKTNNINFPEISEINFSCSEKIGGGNRIKALAKTHNGMNFSDIHNLKIKLLTAVRKSSLSDVNDVLLEMEEKFPFINFITDPISPMHEETSNDEFNIFSEFFNSEFNKDIGEVLINHINPGSKVEPILNTAEKLIITGDHDRFMWLAEKMSDKFNYLIENLGVLLKKAPVNYNLSGAIHENLNVFIVPTLLNADLCLLNDEQKYIEKIKISYNAIDNINSKLSSLDGEHFKKIDLQHVFSIDFTDSLAFILENKNKDTLDAILSNRSGSEIVLSKALDVASISNLSSKSAFFLIDYIKNTDEDKVKNLWRSFFRQREILNTPEEKLFIDSAKTKLGKSFWMTWPSIFTDRNRGLHFFNNNDNASSSTKDLEVFMKVFNTDKNSDIRLNLIHQILFLNDNIHMDLINSGHTDVVFNYWDSYPAAASKLLANIGDGDIVNFLQSNKDRLSAWVGPDGSNILHHALLVFSHSENYKLKTKTSCAIFNDLAIKTNNNEVAPVDLIKDEKYRAYISKLMISKEIKPELKEKKVEVVKRKF